MEDDPMTRVKICGITNLRDALSAVELGADALGFVFAESPREISIKKAERIIERLPPLITTVGVFVNEMPKVVIETAIKCSLDVLQFHGEELPGYFFNFFLGKIIKAFRIKDKSSLRRLPQYKMVDAYLLDAYLPGKRGGSGKTFNWDLALEAKKYKQPIILSGGLTPQNVREAILKVKPYAVDVSSGVEKEPGKKDYRKMKKFIKAVLDVS